VIVPALVRSVFGDEVVDRDFHGYEYAVRTYHEGMIVYVGVTDRVIKVDDADVSVAGIGFVCVHPNYRLRGHMTFAMGIAHDKARERGLKFALLWTGTPEVYRKLGYFPRMNLPEAWLVHELTDKNWDQFASVDLRGSW
jgi:predicted acetyltransferase